MRYRPLGRAGASVSELALGTMTFGNETPEDQAHAQLDRYVEQGGNIVDTADGYVGGESERIVGRWLALQSAELRDDIVLASKGRFPTGPRPNHVGLSRKHLASALDGSLARLGVERIDLYQVHAWDPHTPAEEWLAFLDTAVAAGKVHYVGLSNVTGWQLQRTVDLAEFRGWAAPVSIQPQYNLLSREIEWEILPAAEANGLAVLPWSPLGGGWLTGKYRRDAVPDGGRLAAAPGSGMNGYDRRSADERTWDVIDAVRAIAEARGVPMARVALAWVLGRPAVTSVVLGARTVEQLDDNLATVDLRLDADELDRLDAASAPAIGPYPYGDPALEQRSRRLDGGR